MSPFLNYIQQVSRLSLARCRALCRLSVWLSAALHQSPRRISSVSVAGRLAPRIESSCCTKRTPKSELPSFDSPECFGGGRSRRGACALNLLLRRSSTHSSAQHSRRPLTCAPLWHTEANERQRCCVAPASEPRLAAAMARSSSLGSPVSLTSGQVSRAWLTRLARRDDGDDYVYDNSIIVIIIRFHLLLAPHTGKHVAVIVLVARSLVVCGASSACCRQFRATAGQGGARAQPPARSLDTTEVRESAKSAAVLASESAAETDSDSAADSNLAFEFEFESDPSRSRLDSEEPSRRSRDAGSRWQAHLKPAAGQVQEPA